MPHVERVLQKMREEAAQAKADAVASGAVAPAGNHPISEAPVSSQSADDLLERARKVTLDTTVLEANRVRGLTSSEAGASAYKMLRTRVLQRMRSNSWHKLAITSPRASAGKTLTSINLAISLAHEPNQEVILVDLDLRSPRVAQYLGLTPDTGLVDVLTRDAPLGEVLLKPDIPRLHIVPGAERVENSSELLASRSMAGLVQTLVSTSPTTIVVFDMPPLLEADDMLSFMPLTDAVLFVVAQGETQKSDLEKSNELFKDLNLLGTVLNKSSDESPSQYY